MKVCVVGAGKIGLPIACQMAANGASVTACDINQDVVDAINAGRPPFDEPGLESLLPAVVKSGALRATRDTTGAVRGGDAVIVVVPVLLTSALNADTSLLESALGDVAKGIHADMIVSIESTVPVGTTRRLSSVLETSGLKAGKDFHLVFSPERVKSRHIFERLSDTPKVVGGLTSECTHRGAALYGRFLGAPTMEVESLEAAELVKLSGMIYRDVNIGLANELSRYAERVGVDFWKVIEAANTDGEAAILMPGIGVGGHCTPVYPHFALTDASDRGLDLEITRFGRISNDFQPGWVVRRIEREHGPTKGVNVGILGLAFRPGVKEHTLSPAFALRDELQQRGASVLLNDPLYSGQEIESHGFVPFSLDAPKLPEVLIVQTAHPKYGSLEARELSRKGVRCLVDGRNALNRESVEAAGLVYIGVGHRGRPVASAVAGIPVAKPDLGEREAQSAARVIRSGWVTQGPEVARFEEEFAAYTGASYACAVSSCTAALHLSLLALGIGPGDEVITVSHSFIATANAVTYTGATPVFVDIEPGTYNIDPGLIEPAITPRTKAILAVHQLGMPCDMGAVLGIARQHGLKVIEDAACAAGSEILRDGQWQKIGRPHGDIACFSFHPRKVLTTGDGGMITTGDPEVDAKVRRLRQHGMSVPDTVRHASTKVITESYDEIGYNYRLTDIQAAVGRVQLGRLPGLVERRRRVAAAYDELLSGIDGLELPAQPEWAKSNWQSYCVVLPAGVDRDAAMQRMLDAGIATRRAVMNAHEEKPYRWHDVKLPVSEDIQRRGLLLPMFAAITGEQQGRVAASLQESITGR